MVQHQHADSAIVEEKIGAVEIEKVATLDDVNLESVADEAVGEEQLKIEKRAT
jgi:propanediol dehydratase small subunit